MAQNIFARPAFFFYSFIIIKLTTTLIIILKSTYCLEDYILQIYQLELILWLRMVVEPKKVDVVILYPARAGPLRRHRLADQSERHF
jgi:hypothetical protein